MSINYVRFKANNENDLINKVKEFKKDHSVINVDWDIKNYNTGFQCEQLYLAVVQYDNPSPRKL